MNQWTLVCSGCGRTLPGDKLASLCPDCSQPLMAQFAGIVSREAITTSPDLWRYAAAMPVKPDEAIVSLGEGMTPLLDAPALAAAVGVSRLWIKDEGLNPTGSFKARGMSAAVTRAKALGVRGLVVPTAGNAGAALAAYGAAGGIPTIVVAPETTPRAILDTVRAFGGELVLVGGHIGDAGKEAVRLATERGFFNVATVREPYRVEGMKTMGYEIAQQMNWSLPDAIVYPAGGGEGVIGIWKAIAEMRRWGWMAGGTPDSRMIVAQAEGCAPLVRAVREGSDRARPWENPRTSAAGLRVPSPLGDRLVLRALRESQGDADTATEQELNDAMRELASATGVDAAPEGGCALAVMRKLLREKRLDASSRVVLFNTGAGASYR